jgi:hypothetical protein
MAVKTSEVAGRRKLKYVSFDELLADADRIGSGRVKVLGNWSPGQVFRHLAKAYNGAIDGLAVKFPWHLRTLARLFKKRILSGAMPAGFKVPSNGEKALLPEPVSTEAGLAELHAAVDRFKRETKRAPHPVFGNLTEDEWTRLHLNHAALHMSFLVPET